MNDSKTMSKIFTADQPQKTKDSSIKVLALSVPPNPDISIAFPVFSIIVYFGPFFRVKNGSQTSGPACNYMLFIRKKDYKYAMEIRFVALTPYENFLFALKANESKRQYPHRLDKFLTFMEFQGSIEERCQKFYDFSKNNSELLQSYLVRFINSQKERIDKKEISEGTLHNYVKAIKLFLTMNDIVINWKKLGKGIPQEKQSAEDRIPTTDEICKLIQHSDRRIKIIVYVMISSGIRVGSWDYLKWKHVILY